MIVDGAMIEPDRELQHGYAADGHGHALPGLVARAPPLTAPRRTLRPEHADQHQADADRDPEKADRQPSSSSNAGRTPVMPSNIPPLNRVRSNWTRPTDRGRCHARSRHSPAACCGRAGHARPRPRRTRPRNRRTNTASVTAASIASARSPGSIRDNLLGQFASSSRSLAPSLKMTSIDWPNSRGDLEGERQRGIIFAGLDRVDRLPRHVEVPGQVRPGSSRARRRNTRNRFSTVSRPFPECQARP